MADQETLKDMALHYHRYPHPGKVKVAATKPLGNQRDLALAYSPGVAFACEAIEENPVEARNLTNRGNLVAVITNGTAVLGLGSIGPLASKPVMEGKAVLFKQFADIDVFDIEINEQDPEKLADIVIALEPTFGAVNLEDIKAPDCFIVEQKCREKMGIPVFHDDQHGTAIVVSAAVLNGLRVVEKNIEDVKVVSTGGGAAGIACLNLMVRMGLKPENVTLVDIAGVVYKGRVEEMNPHKDVYAQDTKARKLDEVIEGADIFLGLSAGGILKPEMLMKMADKPLILALANPTPEIMPNEAREARPDAVIATGRSDFPNQVNNVLCFPFIFRGALDVGATTINEEMKLAAVNAIADLATAESSEVVAKAYTGEKLLFGPEYLIPKPFDPRLITHIAPAVAKAAMDSGVATRPIEDFDVYLEKLDRFVFRSGMVMKPIFERVRGSEKRIVFAEGEDERVLRAVRVIVDDEIGRPILVGRPEIIARRIGHFGLRLKVGQDFEICNPENDPRYDQYCKFFHNISERTGIAPDAARTIMRTNNTVIAACMVAQGEADAMICGIHGRFDWHLRYVQTIIGKAKGVHNIYSMNSLVLPKGTFFFSDTHVTLDPSADDLVEMTLIAAHEIRRFGITPKIALLSHSNFGSENSDTAQKVRKAAKILRENYPDLMVDGEMHADNALDDELRERMFPNSNLKGVANLFIMPDQDAAHIAFSMVKKIADGLVIGPILIGAAKPAHILTASVTARGIVNMAAIAAAEAIEDEQIQLI
ncbi:MAG: NADP-dependent malic enzyme [Rhodospirillales bacterium]|jgi:malate dehydrogenase (oxaloacetate-decarboxylating)(NADP+)|nr:NADP-dependent malic enzyme [Rhodospirillales bacterium]